MFNRTVYLISFILFLLAFISCQESTTGLETMNDDSKILWRETTTDVQGYVYKESNPVSGATVKLYKGAMYLSQTTSNDTGYYKLNVCGHQQGSGTYSVRATKYIREEEWCDSESFYWDEEVPWLFEIDLYLVHCEQK